MRPLLLLAALLAAIPAAAQAPGEATFRVYGNDQPIGSVRVALTQTPEGWRLQGSSEINSQPPVRIPNFDLYYDRNWRGRFMTMEMKAPDEVLLHVAVVGDVTRTDVVRATEARFRANSVSPDTIFLPDRVYGAYEAVAARVGGAFPGGDLPLLIPPIGETRASIDARSDVRVTTTTGPIIASRYELTEIRERPTPVVIWTDNGRLLRLDFPRSGVSVIRSDVVGQP